MRPALIAALVATLTARAGASPGSEFEEAKQSFRHRDCESAIPKLKDLLYPREKLGLLEDIVEARSMLGACDFDTNNPEEARAEFEKVLQLQPTRTLDDLLYTKGSVRLFDSTKADVEARARRDAEVHKAELATARIEAIQKSLALYEAHPYYVNFVPFGAGQFQEGNDVRGVVFAIGEGLTLATSAGVWAYLVSKYGLVSKNVPLADGPGVLRLQEIEILSGVGFIVFYAVGVVDSLRHYKRRERELGSVDTILPMGDDTPAAKPKAAPKKPTSMLDRIHIGPMLVPGGAGVGIGWEN